MGSACVFDGGAAFNACASSLSETVQLFNRFILYVIPSRVHGGVSLESTIPASTPEAKRNAAAGVAAAKAIAAKAAAAKAAAAKSTAQTTTPPPREARASPETSAPKLSRTIQSKRVLEPVEEGVPTKNTAPHETNRKTAAKAKAKHRATAPTAKSKAAPKPKVRASAQDAEVDPKPALKVPKVEVKADPSTTPEHNALATAVQESLRRGSTMDITPHVGSAAPAKHKAAKADAPSTAAPGGSDHDDAADDDDDPQTDPKAEELARRKRAAHARYMRFSRSVNSCLAA